MFATEHVPFEHAHSPVVISLFYLSAALLRPNHESRVHFEKRLYSSPNSPFVACGCGGIDDRSQLTEGCFSSNC
jgi:hypothetical protein